MSWRTDSIAAAVIAGSVLLILWGLAGWHGGTP